MWRTDERRSADPSTGSVIRFLTSIVETILVIALHRGRSWSFRVCNADGLIKVNAALHVAAEWKGTTDRSQPLCIGLNYA